MNAPAMNIRAAADIPPLRRSDQDAIAHLVLNRPAARNALSDALLAGLADAFARIADDRDVRAVVISAEGPVFCAGHDLKEVTAYRGDPDGGRARYADLFARCADVMTRIVRLPQPVIAAVDGVATAAGCQLVASCDLAVAGATSRFATPGVNIGLFCSTPMVALSRNVAPKHAMEMLLTGEMVDAEGSARIGLVNRVVPAGEALVEAMRLATIVASKSAKVVAIGKRAFYAQREMCLDEAYAYTSNVMVENMLTADAAEGIQAFVGKRSPVWSVG